ncbi:Gfo/Idh/MocA family protein [Paenibacillus sp. D9]|uniref:Gfo/Idh/MocA family protein n=1 Tax=Paenibacillus sp. D9 TaxID=665792 RepID=UPI001E36491A|nr:Gfo/Idh/MocA family oxidoreductase [Paenibacillus sp. D9]
MNEETERSMDKIRLAVIGLGVMGRNMIVQKAPGFPEAIELAAVCDPNAAAIDNILGSAGGVRTYADYRIMLDEGGIDLLYIAVPPAMHHEVATAAFEKNIHVFCEKPLANSLEEAREMAELAAGSELVNAVHFSFPLDPPVLKLKELLEDGAAGTVERIELFLQFPQWPRAWQQNGWVATREQGGFLLEVGIHWIHMIQQIFGRIARLSSEVSYPADSALSENRAEATLTLESGIPIALSGSTGLPGEERVSMVVHGSQGVIALENWQHLYSGVSVDSLQAVDTDGIASPLPMLKQVIAALRGEDALVYDFADGYNAQVVLEALRQSAGSTVELGPLYIARR